MPTIFGKGDDLPRQHSVNNLLAVDSAIVVEGNRALIVNAGCGQPQALHQMLGRGEGFTGSDDNADTLRHSRFQHFFGAFGHFVLGVEEGAIEINGDEFDRLRCVCVGHFALLCTIYYGTNTFRFYLV